MNQTSDSPEHAAIVRAVMLRMSRNLIRYQQIEHGLKLVLPSIAHPESQIAPTSDDLAALEVTIGAETLGALHARLTKALIRKVERQPGFDGDVPTPKDLIDRERRVVDDRNRLVHHFELSELTSGNGCRALIAELDAAYARAEELFRLVGTLSVVLIHTFASATGDGVARAEFSAAAEQLSAQLGVRFEPDCSFEAWQDPVATLEQICSADWMLLSRAGKLLYVAAPLVRPTILKAGGLRAWAMNQPGFELRERPSTGIAPPTHEIRRRSSY